MKGFVIMGIVNRSGIIDNVRVRVVLFECMVCFLWCGVSEIVVVVVCECVDGICEWLLVCCGFFCRFRNGWRLCFFLC